MLQISRFYAETLRAPLKNRTWSWGAFDVERNRVFLSVWQDDIRKGRRERVRLLRSKRTNKSPGYDERRAHIEAIRNGATGFGILCTAKDPTASRRKIVNIDKSSLLILKAISTNAEGTFAQVGGRIPLHEITRSHDSQSNLQRDLDAIIRRKDIPSTTKEALVNARVGQGNFRSSVLTRWGSRCCVTGSSTREMIRASHIKPWRDSTDKERLDPNNGLPLTANLDALFDAGLISFSASGTMLFSMEFPESERRILGPRVASLAKRLPEGTAEYLRYHREHVFRR